MKRLVHLYPSVGILVAISAVNLFFDFRYGDIAPRSVPGRIIAIVWTIVGLVVWGITSGALTSSITTKTLPTNFKLYGTKVS